jgi:branched-chain amino acid transport system substrate-binding protein
MKGRTRCGMFFLGAAVLMMGAFMGNAYGQEPIRIGWLSSLTGALSAAAIAENQGVQIAVGEINKAGGIMGRKIELLTRDTQGDPTKATSYAQQLIKNDKVHFIIGPVHSGEGLATVPVIAKAGVPNIVIGTVDILTNPEKYPLAFRVIPTNTQWIDAANNYSLNELGWKKVALLGDNSGYGTSTQEQAEKMLIARGVQITYKALIDANQTDVTADMRKAMQTKPDGIQIWSAATGLDARIIEARSNVGWDVTIAGHPAIAAINVGKLLSKPQNWDKVYAVGYKSTSYDANGQLPPRTQEFLKKAEPVLGKEIDYTLWWVVMGYDAVQAIREGVTKAGSTDPTKWKTAMEGIKNFPGMFANYTWGKGKMDGYPTEELAMNVASSFKNGTYQLAPYKK